MGLKPALQNIRAVGTDGEQALANALTTQFKQVIHLRCFLHMCGNLEAKLSELKLPKAVIQEFIWDVFDNPTLLQLGLVDAEDSSELDAQFLHLKTVWDEKERVFTSQELGFQEKRSLAGLVCPP